MKFVEGSCWLVTWFMAMFAGFRLIGLWLMSGASAPQYAAEAAGISAMVIVPYVFSRAVQGMRRLGDLDARAPAREEPRPATPAA